MFRPFRDYLELGMLISLLIMMWVVIVYLIKYILT